MSSNIVKPDGGWKAWLVVAASFMISAIQDGILYSFGVFLPSLTTFFETGRATTTIILSVMTFMTLGFGPVAAFLVDKLGHRGTTIFGAALSCLAFFLTALLAYFEIKYIVVYYIVTGGLVGIGFCFMYLPAVAVIDHWFDKKIGLAQGVAAAGSGVGQFALAPLCDLIISKVGPIWSFVILGVIASTGIIFGLAYIMPSKDQEPDITQSEETKCLQDASNETLPEETTGVSSCNFQKFYNISVLKNPKFSIYVACSLIFNSGVYIVFGFTTDRARSFGIDSDMASWIFSAMGIANFIGKMTCGKVVDMVIQKFGDKAVIFVSIILVLVIGFSIIISQLLVDIIGQIICATVFGFAFGGIIPSHITYIKKIGEDFDSLFGFWLFFFGLASLIGPVIVGAMYDKWNDYAVGYYSAGGAVILSAFILLIIPLMESRSKSKAQNSHQSEA